MSFKPGLSRIQGISAVVVPESQKVVCGWDLSNPKATAPITGYSCNKSHISCGTKTMDFCRRFLPRQLKDPLKAAWPGKLRVIAFHVLDSCMHGECKPALKELVKMLVSPIIRLKCIHSANGTFICIRS